MRPLGKRWARIGPRDTSWLIHTPHAGLCLSAFVVARKGRSILLGRPRALDAWPKIGGFPKFRAAEIEREGAWVLPATHLLMEEPPDRAALRIAHQWAGLNGTPRFMMVQSHIRPARKGQHWDICFVYDMSIKRLPKVKPWWSEMRLHPIKNIRKMKIGRGHRDVLEEAGYL